MTEIKSIWLEPSPGSDPDGGRMWAPNDVWGDGTEYVLASRLSDAEARIKELEAKLADADAMIEAQQHDFAQNNIRNAENAHRAEASEALLDEVVTAWEALSGGEQYVRAVERWLSNDMEPVIDKIRAARVIQDKIGVKGDEAHAKLREIVARNPDDFAEPYEPAGVGVETYKVRRALELLIRCGEKQGWNDAYDQEMAFARVALKGDEQ